MMKCGTGPGLAQDLVGVMDKLRAKDVFVRQVDTRGIAYHSPYLEDGLEELRAGMLSLTLAYRSI